MDKFLDPHSWLSLITLLAVFVGIFVIYMIIGSYVVDRDRKKMGMAPKGLGVKPIALMGLGVTAVMLIGTVLVFALVCFWFFPVINYRLMAIVWGLGAFPGYKLGQKWIRWANGMRTGKAAITGRRAVALAVIYAALQCHMLYGVASFINGVTGDREYRVQGFIMDKTQYDFVLLNYLPQRTTVNSLGEYQDMVHFEFEVEEIKTQIRYSFWVSSIEFRNYSKGDLFSRVVKVGGLGIMYEASKLGRKIKDGSFFK